MNLEVKGFKYRTFGLRKEWLYQILTQEDFFSNNNLGPKQIEAFICFLKDCELIDRKRNFTELFKILRKIFEKEGIDSKLLWGIIWINLCFNSHLFKWWANQKEGFYTRDDIIDLLADSYGKKNRYIVNGYSSILETLERSPIGIYFGQGIVRREGRSRVVLKEKENLDIPSHLILYNLYKLAKKVEHYRFNLREMEENPLSPQKIFSLSSEKIEYLLSTVKTEELLDIELEKRVYIILKNSLDPIEVLKISLGGIL